MEPDAGSVNIIGHMDSEDRILDESDDTERILNRLGVRVNCNFLSDCTSEEIRGMRRGRVNILSSRNLSADRQADIIKNVTGIDWYPEQLPRGLNQVLGWVDRFGTFMGCDRGKVDALLSDLRAEYASLTEDLVGELEGRMTIVYTSTSSDLEWLLEIFDMLGVEVLEILCATNSVWNVSEDSLRLSKDIPVLYDRNTGDLEKEIESLKPTFVIGSDYTQHSLKTPHVILGPPRPGIRSAVEQARRLVRMVKVMDYVDN